MNNQQIINHVLANPFKSRAQIAKVLNTPLKELNVIIDNWINHGLKDKAEKSSPSSPSRKPNNNREKPIYNPNARTKAERSESHKEAMYQNFLAKLGG